MKVYLAWWDNGWSYEDHERRLIGVFSKKKLAGDAAEMYLKASHGENQLFDRRARIEIQEVKLDEAAKWNETW